MSPSILLKTLASFLNVTPEEITANFEQFRRMAMGGVQLLEEVNTRLARIEEKLGIEPLAPSEPSPGEPPQLERQE